MSSQAVMVAAYGTTDVGKERDRNEDAFGVFDTGAAEIVPNEPYVADATARPVTMAVSDGMGGEKAGDVASTLTLETFRRALALAVATCEPHEALRQAIEQANDEVTIAGKTPGRAHMGATLVAVVVVGPQAYVASVGDSRAYVLRQGVLTQLTTDQSLVQFLVERGAVAPRDAKAFPHRNVILQAIGHAASLTVSIRRLSLRRDDRLLLCTDGLSGELDDDEIRTLLAADARVDQICAHLVAAANAYGGHDNITVVVASASGPGLPESSADESVAQTLVSLEPGGGSPPSHS